VSVISILFAGLLARKINKASQGEGKMVEVAQAIKEGAIAFLKRQYKAVSIVAAIIFVILWIVFDFKTGLGFLVGAVASASAGIAGMLVSTKANIRVAQATKTGLKAAFNLSFRGGAVTGFLVAGLGLLSVSSFYLLTHDLKALVALGFGGSLISVFARLGGGIYTKAADVGADLVGKLEKGIPEDDIRNPAVIADQVGDNVGDCAGMAADLFETFVVTVVAAMVLGALLFPGLSQMVLLPLVLSSIAILTSIIATFFVRLGKKGNIMGALYKGVIAAGVLSALGFIPVFLNLQTDLGISFKEMYLPAFIGLVIAGLIFMITEFFTSTKYSQVRAIAKASESGHGTNVIAGLAVGMRSTILPVIVISLGILASFNVAGIYGLAISAVAMISLTGIIVALDAYGPITDNAAGILEMAGFPEENRETADALDAVGNTTKAVTKGFAIGSAGLAALVLFSAFTQELADLGKTVSFTLDNPYVLIGLLSGGVIAYYFSALAMEAVGKSAGKVVDEVRRQFKEIPGIMEGTAKPDYSKCVDIVTKTAIMQMILPALLPVIFPIIIGVIFGIEALGGLLIGSIVVGIFLAIQMTSGGGAWDNAKKYIELGNHGGKGSFAHQAAITGDTIGDPFKDTAGPAINPMIKVLNIVALLIVGLLM